MSEHTVTKMPLTEELFFEFIRTKFPYSTWPEGWNIHDTADAQLAASWLLHLLQELNAFLLEKEEVIKNMNETRVPVPRVTKKAPKMDRKETLKAMKELEME